MDRDARKPTLLDNGIADAATAIARWRVWLYLGLVDINRTYTRAEIGLAWVILQAAAWVTLIAIVFNPIFVDDFPEYLSYVAIAVVAYNTAAHIFSSSADAFLRHRGTILNIPAPMLLFPLRTCVSGFYVGLLQAPVAIFVVWFQGSAQLDSLIWLFLAIPCFLVFLVGISICFAYIGAFSGDFRFLVQISMRFLFFATPIFWVMPEEPGLRRLLGELNPLTHFLEMFRGGVLGYAPSTLNLTVVACASVGAITLGAIFHFLLTNRTARIL
jgi:ABC-type polysaccharide/polyol phosphate export permease